MIKEISTLVFLGLNSGLDIWKKEISLLSAAGFGIVWLFLGIFQKGISPELFLPYIMGGLFLGLNILTRNQVGLGDGILLLALGTVLSWQELLRTLLLAVTGCGVWSLILLTACHKNRKTRVPFVPFLLLGYAGGLLL